MKNTALYEIFLSTHPQRIAAVEAASIWDAHDRAITLFPGVNWRLFIIVPTTYAAIVAA